jgi:uncharacterized protein
MTWLKTLYFCTALMAAASLISCDDSLKLPKLSVEQIKDLQDRAGQDDPRAQYNLAQCYLVGMSGLEKSNKHAVDLLVKSASNGFPRAQMQLGDGYAKGTPETPKNLNKAYEWWFLALAGGENDAEPKVKKSEANTPKEEIDANRMASFMLYTSYIKKDGEVPRSQILLFFAHNGVAQAQCDVGDCYFNGDGVAKDYSEATKWYSLPAHEGYTPAELYMGQAYAEGFGVLKDATLSLKWYFKAANKGDSIGQARVAMANAEGIGMPANAVEAYKWWNLASVSARSDEGEEMAKLRKSMAACRDEIAIRMTAKQIEEAQQKCRDWKPVE